MADDLEVTGAHGSIIAGRPLFAKVLRQIVP